MGWRNEVVGSWSSRHCVAMRGRQGLLLLLLLLLLQRAALLLVFFDSWKCKRGLLQKPASQDAPATEI